MPRMTIFIIIILKLNFICFVLFEFCFVFEMPGDLPLWEHHWKHSHCADVPICWWWVIDWAVLLHRLVRMRLWTSASRNGGFWSLPETSEPVCEHSWLGDLREALLRISFLLFAECGGVIRRSVLFSPPWLVLEIPSFGAPPSIVFNWKWWLKKKPIGISFNHL